MNEYTAPAQPDPPGPRYEPRVRTNLPWLFATLGMLLVFLFVPTFVERIQYAVTHGRERAEADVARSGLPSPSLTSVSHEFAVVAKAIEPSVVHIDTVQIVNGVRGDFADSFAPRAYRAEGQGSGVVIDEDGYVLTNYHVVENAQVIRVKLNDQETRAADMVGFDAGSDLAVLKISSGGLIAAPWGDSDALEVGSLVWAVGNPYGLDRSVTAGIISAKSRRGLRGSPYQDFLQTDAAVNPGNSGGPLVDASGKIVGITTAIVGRTYQGISFSIPSRTARDVYEQLRAEGKIERGYLGVRLRDLTPDFVQSRGLKTFQGALVEELADGTPAANAGIEPGDVIVEWNGQPVMDATELILLVGKTKVGSVAKVGLIRDGKRIELNVTVEAQPARPAR